MTRYDLAVKDGDTFEIEGTSYLLRASEMEASWIVSSLDKSTLEPLTYAQAGFAVGRAVQKRCDDMVETFNRSGGSAKSVVVFTFVPLTITEDEQCVHVKTKVGFVVLSSYLRNK